MGKVVFSWHLYYLNLPILFSFIFFFGNLTSSIEFQFSALSSLSGIYNVSYLAVHTSKPSHFE